MGNHIGRTLQAHLHIGPMLKLIGQQAIGRATAGTVIGLLGDGSKK